MLDVFFADGVSELVQPGDSESTQDHRIESGLGQGGDPDLIGTRDVNAQGGFEQIDFIVDQDPDAKSADRAAGRIDGPQHGRRDACLAAQLGEDACALHPVADASHDRLVVGLAISDP